LAASLCVGLVGCAQYTPLPLTVVPPLAPDIAALASAPSTPDQLSVEQVVQLALANNPDLRAARRKRATAAAQTEQAGILPNPTLTGALLPLISGVGSVPAWSIGLSQNIKAIVTYKSRQQAARDSEQQVAADIVWQEWQVAGRARQIAADMIMTARSRPLYLESYTLLAQRNTKLETELAAQRITLTMVAPDRTALQAARTALDTFDQKRLTLQHQLNALLGLRPDAVVPLATAPNLPPFDPVAVRADLSGLPNRRPDLLALRLGYAAADENVRQAILSQFPNLILGGGTNSDNAKVINAGPNVSLGLPIFDRNQGNIAIANATRAQLQAEYAARLAAATGEVGALLSEAEQLSQQLAVTRRDLPAARAAAQHAQAAFAASNLDERSYVDLISNRFTKEEEVASMETALLDRQIAIQTLIGAGLPTAELPVGPAPGGA
jgi:outer membrane protein TolC